MKLNLKKVSALATTGFVLFSGCSVKNDFTKNKYQVDPEVLEVHGDTVNVTISALVPEKSINSKANVRFEPVLNTSKGDLPMRTMTIGGESVEDPVDAKVNSKEGGKVSYSARVRYTPDMRSAKLMSGFSVKDKKTGDYKSLNEIPGVSRELAKGTITTSTLVRPDVKPRFVGDVYKTEMKGKTVEMYFPQNKSKFDLGYGIKKLKLTNKGQIEELKKLFKKDPNFVPGSIKLTSFASPDGEMALNGDLAKERSLSSYAYFKKELKRIGFASANDSNFTMTYEATEDWAGLKTAVENSTLADKNEMLAIINNKGIGDDQREETLRNSHRKSYDWLISDVFPKLRRSNITVFGITPLRTDDQLRALANGMKWDSLTAYEIYHLAYVVNNNETRLAIADYYIKHYPDDWRMYNDKAAALMMMGKYQDAMSMLEKADGISPNNETVLHNMGVAYMKNNMRAKAEAMFKRSGSSYGLGLIAIQKGQYNEAISYLSKADASSNVALAYLLNKQVDEAKKVLQRMNPDEMNAYCYYLMAIVGARTNDVNMLTTNLGRAIKEFSKEEGMSESAAKQYAASDLEFRNFFENPLFQAAVK